MTRQWWHACLKRVGNFTSAIVFLASAVACVPAAADHLDTLTLQLKGPHQFQFAGYYAAQEKGFYREKGLDVRLLEATPETDVIDEVVSRRAEFGVGNSALLLARAKGKPVVALAAIFQHSPLMLYGHIYSGISSVRDLKGKRIMLEPNAEELLAFLRREGIPESTLITFPHTFSTDELTLGRVDAMSGQSTSTPFHLDKRYIPYVALSPRSAGIDFYGDILFASAEEMHAHPKRTAAFREASLKGWEYALEHPDEIADIIRARYARGLSRELLLFEAERIKPLVKDDLLTIGHMRGERWKSIINIYSELGLLTGDLNLKDFLYIDNAKKERQQADQKWAIGLSIAVAVGTLASLIAVFMLRLNRRMKREMAAREQAVNELRESEAKFRFITENSGDVIWILDIASGRFTYVSPAVEDLRGYTPDEVLAQPMDTALTPESAERAQAILKESIARWNAGDHSQTPRVTEIDQPHKDGHVVHTEVVTTLHADAGGKPAYVIGVTRNITERKRAEEAIRRLAFYDPLTDLANRRLLLDRLPQQIARARRDQHRLAILYIDLDKFKPINDRLGHEAGDWLLRSVAGRIRKCLRQSDTAARVGGDEFVVLLPDIQHPGQAQTVAEKISQELQQAFITDANEALRISSSIGIAIYPDHSENDQELLRMADEAMYHAKKAGSGRVELFLPVDAASNVATDTHHVLHLVWRPSYTSRHPAIDQQHRELFRLANALLDAAPAHFEEAFDTLLAHVEQHFADEETVLRDHAYEALAEHSASHRELIRSALELRRRVAEKKVSMGELVDFLARDVVARHMLQEDRKFFGLFDGQGKSH
jgi:diguanylate cyclase (GGDEF)-like protein/hemerythrin-like metal-binding protein/PAS domain S-box-containing protein